MLVVDDDDAVRDVITEVLRSNKYTVVCAENGESALRALRGGRPGVMLLDLTMPVMSGWELLEYLKEHDDAGNPSIVVISATTAPGAYEHLPKPVDPDLLLEAVDRLMA